MKQFFKLNDAYIDIDSIRTIEIIHNSLNPIRKYTSLIQLNNSNLSKLSNINDFLSFDFITYDQAKNFNIILIDNIMQGNLGVINLDKIYDSCAKENK